jgi:hypothetical protein
MKYNKHVAGASHLYLVCISSILGACEPDLSPTSYSTTHLEIETSFQDPLCRGDLDRWDNFLNAVEAQLGVQLEPGLEVYLWDV